MPFHWYFTSALPRSLLGTLPFVFLGGLFERRIRPFVLITAAYILLYSFLPHKEVRFDCNLGIGNDTCVQSYVGTRYTVEVVHMQPCLWFNATVLYNLLDALQLLSGVAKALSNDGQCQPHCVSVSCHASSPYASSCLLEPSIQFFSVPS